MTTPKKQQTKHLDNVNLENAIFIDYSMSDYIGILNEYDAEIENQNNKHAKKKEDLFINVWSVPLDYYEESTDREFYSDENFVDLDNLPA